MSYVNPGTLPTPPIPLGLERAIEDMRGMLEVNLPWLSFAFGRAFTFNETSAKIPKCYVGNGEYINVLPNDTLFRPITAASLFFQLRSTETYSIFNYQHGSTKQATVGIIFWGNLKLIDSAKNYIFTEELKNDVEQVIKTNPYVQQIDEWIDERVEDVFDKYTIDPAAQYLMYPYTGFRVNVIINYPESCGDEALTDYEANETLSHSDDIDFLVGHESDAERTVTVINANVFEIPFLIGKKIRVLRNNIKQSKTINRNGWVYAFNPTNGRITLTPDPTPEELISIEII